MPNLASLLKDEISRVSRKVIKSEVASLRKASSQYRSDIAALKRRVVGLEQQLRRVSKSAKALPSATAGDEAQGPVSIRFSPSGLAKHRARLGLTLKEAGALLGASELSVSRWEKEDSAVTPRGKFLPAIAAFRKLGRREARARLEAMGL